MCIRDSAEPVREPECFRPRGVCRCPVSYTHLHLLETLLELPAGKAIAWFDRTDPVKARDIIGDHMCIAGGISPSLLIGGSVQEIDLQVKKLLTEMKKAPGFIFTLPFNAIGPAKIENVLAMTEAVHRYGGYTQPVSYTHLDVYKRQGMHIPASDLISVHVEQQNAVVDKRNDRISAPAFLRIVNSDSVWKNKWLTHNQLPPEVNHYIF